MRVSSLRTASESWLEVWVLEARVLEVMEVRLMEVSCTHEMASSRFSPQEKQWPN